MPLAGGLQECGGNSWGPPAFVLICSDMSANGHEDRNLTGSAQTFSTLIDEVRNGSQEAAEQLWRQYGGHVLHVVRRLVNQRMRSLLDSEDFSQAVWASFFARMPDASDIDSPEALIRVLVQLARCKVAEERRRLYRKQRNITRQEPFSDGNDPIDERMPTPSQVAVAQDLVENLDSLAAVKSSKFGRVVRMSRDGFSAVEIAEKEEISSRSVRRILRDVRRRFLRMWSKAHD